jgi:hypothetical protein
MPRVSARKLIALYVLLCCGVLLVCAGCEKSPDDGAKESEFEIDKDFERGPLTVHVRADKAKMTIAETVLLELEAAIEPGYEVQMPKVDKVLENFGIVDWDSLGDKLDEKGNVVSKYQYRLEPFLSGTYSVPAFAFEFHDVNSPEDKKYELTTEPFDIEVTSLLGEQRAELKIDDIEDVVEIPQEPSFLWAWALGAIAVTAAAGAWLYLRRKRAKELGRIFKPAHESDILRHYIEHRFSLRAPERTTEEFLFELANTDILSESDKESLGEFLQHCDLVKFAKHEPTTEQIQETFDLVKNFVEKTKSDERKVDITDMVVSEEPVEIGSA